MNVLLDTCAIIWAVCFPERIPAASCRVLKDEATMVHVSPISAAEIACACERGKLQLDRHWKRWFRHFTELNGWILLPIRLAEIEEAWSLPGTFHQDPADRIIVASARCHKLAVITGDKLILDYPHVDILWE